jgi:putative Ca2+/H+ antiporter (TMEM165/GDT1 family)
LQLRSPAISELFESAYVDIRGMKVLLMFCHEPGRKTTISTVIIAAQGRGQQRICIFKSP